MLELAIEAREFMAAKEAATDLKRQYRDDRDRFRHAVPGRDWADYLQDPAFQLCTRKSFNAWQKAKRQQYNAERRLERRYRRLISIGGGA